MAILTAVSDDEMRAFLSAYAAYRPGNTSSWRGIEAGTVNTSFALELGEGRFFLRIYEQQGLEGARREARLALHLAAHGVPTPTPICGTDGESVRVLAGKPAALFPWVEGEMLCQAGVSVEAAQAVGRALAKVHLVGPPPGAPMGEGRFEARDLVARCDEISASSSPARAEGADLRARVMELGARRRRDLPQGLVHGDLFRDNVLWVPRSGSTIAALLDFESAHHGSFVYDLAVTVLSWCYGTGLVPELAAAVARGYGEVRPLEAAERDAFFDEARFATLRFTITRIADDAIRVGKRWQRFVERREALERLGGRALREVLGW